MVKLNTEEIIVEVSGAVFGSSLNIRERKSSKKIGEMALGVPVMGVSHLHIRIEEENRKYEEEILIALGQYFFATQGVKEIRLHGIDRPFFMEKKDILLPSDIERLGLKTPVVPCAIVILLSDKGEVLLGKRPEGKFMPDVWEAPGGKIEAGEGVLEAASRELQEELGIQIVEPRIFKTLTFQYKNFKLQGHLCVATKWMREPENLVHSEIRWVPLKELASYSMPLSNLIYIQDVMSLIE